MITKQELRERAKIKGLLKNIKSKEYAIVDINSIFGLYTADLGSDIAYTLYSKELNKAGMGRQLDTTKLKEFFTQYLHNSIAIKEPIKMLIFGGDASFTTDNTRQLLDSFKQSYNVDSIKIFIECFDVGIKPHLNSVIFEPYTGFLWDGENVPNQILIGVTEFVENTD